jgi:hypothetical protein
MRTPKTTTKTLASIEASKAKGKNRGLPVDADADNSKPAQLARLLFSGIVRMIKAKKSRERGKTPKFTLDSSKASRICLGGD